MIPMWVPIVWAVCGVALILCGAALIWLAVWVSR